METVSAKSALSLTESAYIVLCSPVVEKYRHDIYKQIKPIALKPLRHVDLIHKGLVTQAGILTGLHETLRYYSP